MDPTHPGQVISGNGPCPGERRRSLSFGGVQVQDLAIANTMSTAAIRVVLVEDDKEIRQLMRNALEREGMRVVGSFGNGEDFLARYPELIADVVIMDIGLPGSSGIDCVRQAKPLRPSTQFLMMTVFENPAYIFQTLCMGATGYIVKGASQAELAQAVRELVQGGSPMSPGIARLVVDSFQGQVKVEIQDHALTARERGILDQLATGLMYKEIAAKEGISIETVRKHARNIYEKLQVGSRLEAIRKVYPNR